MLRRLVSLFLLASIMGLAACTNMTPEQRDQTRHQLFLSINDALVQLQTLDMAKVEVDSAYRQIAGVACITAQTLIPAAVPYMNQQLKLTDDKAITVDEAVGTIRDICATVQQVLVDKAPAAPASSPAPVPKPEA